MKRQEFSAPALRCLPWTAWPSLLSLDAVLVALAWQQLLMRSFCSRSATWTEIGSLAAAVWLIYVADRLLDASRLKHDQLHTLRHWFYRRHGRLFAVLWIVVLVSASIVVVRELPTEVLRSGWLLAAAVVVYGANVHFASQAHAITVPATSGSVARWGIPKEVRVGTLFALGVSLTTWTQLTTNAPVIVAGPSEVAMMVGMAEGACWSLAASTCALAILFSCNCILVACFERELDRAQAFASIATRGTSLWKWMARGSDKSLPTITWLTFLPILLLLLLLQLPTLIFIAVAVSALALGLSVMLPNRPESLLEPQLTQAVFDIRSVWVDFALWTPPLVMLCAA